MAGVTFREAARKKLLWIALAAGFAFLALFATGLHYQLQAFAERGPNPILQREVLSTQLVVGLYAITMLSVLMTVVTSVDTLSGEISSGTIQAVATKPVPRWQLLIGKWLGFAAMLTVFLVILVGGINVLTYSMGGVVAHHLLRGLALIWMEGLLLLSLTFLFGTYFSTISTGVTVLGLHGLAFIGGWIEQMGALTQTQKAVNVGIFASVLMPSESLWRRAAYEMQSPLASVSRFSPFGAFSVPSWMMVAYAATYLLIVLLLAIRRFAKRDL
jgi:Cu-processing system permease protein